MFRSSLIYSSSGSGAVFCRRWKDRGYSTAVSLWTWCRIVTFQKYLILINIPVITSDLARNILIIRELEFRTHSGANLPRRGARNESCVYNVKRISEGWRRVHEGMYNSTYINQSSILWFECSPQPSSRSAPICRHNKAKFFCLRMQEPESL
jgi:hypothetical protein